MISGVILAAGSSVRLGGGKQLLELGGVPLLQHVIDAAAAARLDEVVVVLGDRADEIRAALSLDDGVRTVVNADHARGMGTSLRVGLEAADPSSAAAAVLLGDQPGVTAALVDEVVDRFRSSEADVVRPTYEGTPGHPVVIRRSAWDAALELTGDEGLRAVLGRLSVDEVEMHRPPPLDVDTPEDLRALRDRS